MSRIRDDSLLHLPKVPTGISGLDAITGGGLPRGRTTLVCGAAGCGKTLLAMRFLVHGCLHYDEPGVFVSFEETEAELVANFSSLGVDLRRLQAEKKILIDYVQVERHQFEETGEYDLEGLFLRLGSAIDAIGAKRVALDSIESLFGGLPNEAILRAELSRLFRWLKAKDMSAIVSAEPGQGGMMTRHGLEEYVSDCVIVLDHRLDRQVSTRRLRVVKYRGTTHCADEYPFLIDQRGFEVLPVTELGLDHPAAAEHVPSGLPRLDAMLGGQGFHLGSSILVSGTAGTGKSSLGAHFVDAACRRGDRCLYFAFEESPQQIVRNMRSIGIDLDPWVEKGRLRFHATRPSRFGLEMHLATVQQQTLEFQPRVVVIDPITNFASVGAAVEIHSMLMRIVDFLKSRQITALFTSLTHGDAQRSGWADAGVASLMDTWVVLGDLDGEGDGRRGIHILKSRGMAHTNRVREFRFTGQGIQIVEPDDRAAGLDPAARMKGAARPEGQPRRLAPSSGSG